MMSVERYDPVSNTWTLVDSMLNYRSNHEIAIIGTEIYVIGGNDAKTKLNTMEVYNIKENKWKVAPLMKHIRSEFAVIMIFTEFI
ncbi:kelch-like protein 7 [Arctopsyche grandis]|uniref:kelch-like protein 7 n=1 Tax=Arctopsyche grandis TaxID=121162 RepID=UPI00406D662A